jgi:hypothetical protein
MAQESDVVEPPVGQPPAAPVQPSPLLPGVPPTSISSSLSFGTIGTDVDKFLSTTGFQDIGYQKGFGYLGLDNTGLSAGISGVFGRAVTSLYYNGNIIEDLFMIIANNPNAGGGGISSYEGINGTDFTYKNFEETGPGDLDSRSNVALLFGIGNIGIKAGYSQTLNGFVKDITSAPYRETENGVTTANGLIDSGKTAALSSSMAPYIEAGLRFGTDRMFRLILSFSYGINTEREFSKGEQLNITNYFDPAAPGPYELTRNDSVIRKSYADYTQPTVALRFEAEYPISSNSRISMGIETGGSTKLYNNTDDTGKTLDGNTFQSVVKGPDGADGYEYSISKIENFTFMGKPSVRYIHQFTNRLLFGLSGSIGLNMVFGNSTTKTYSYATFSDYIVDPNSMIGSTVSKDDIDTDLTASSSVGIGMSFAVLPEQFIVNLGVSADQDLYQVRSGTNTLEILGNVPTKSPILEQTWGKPTAKIALGSTLMLKKNLALDAMFSTNGTSLDGSNFVLQESVKL